MNIPASADMATPTISIQQFVGDYAVYLALFCLGWLPVIIFGNNQFAEYVRHDGLLAVILISNPILTSPHLSHGAKFVMSFVVWSTVIVFLCLVFGNVALRPARSFRARDLRIPHRSRRPAGVLRREPGRLSVSAPAGRPVARPTAGAPSSHTGARGQCGRDRVVGARGGAEKK